MKRKLPVLIGILCVLSIALGAFAATVVQEIKAEIRPDFTVKIDGEVKEFKNVNGEVVYPILYDGTTYLPVRAIGELMGKRVYWFEEDKRVELKDYETTVTDADVIVTEGDAVTDKPADKNPDKPAKEEPDKSAFIGADKAKEIALEKAGVSAGSVIFDRVELDEDDGIWHYEVEFSKGYTEYDADIKADDGTILKWDVDTDD